MVNAMGVTTSLMTFEEFERLPDEPGKLELLKGDLIRLPPPKRKHMEAAEALFSMLAERLRRMRKRMPDLDLGKAHIEMGYRLGPNSWLRPDVSIAHRGQPGDDYLEGAPALAVEVISESNTAADMEAKVREYLAKGGREVWVVYPKTKAIWIYEADGAAVARQGQFSSSLLPGVSIDLNAILGERAE
jgi:Uma2 family endonuclease